MGGGKMAKAMAASLVRAGVCSSADINMSARTQTSFDAIAALGYGVGTNTEVRLYSFPSTHHRFCTCWGNTTSPSLLCLLAHVEPHGQVV